MAKIWAKNSKWACVGHVIGTIWSIGRDTTPLRHQRNTWNDDLGRGDTIATPRIELVAVGVTICKTIFNWWNFGRTTSKIGRTATKQNLSQKFEMGMCWAHGRHNLEHWSRHDTIATPETMTLVAATPSRHPELSWSRWVSQYVKQSLIDEMFVTPRVKLVAPRPSKIRLNFWCALGAWDEPTVLLGG